MRRLRFLGTGLLALFAMQLCLADDGAGDPEQGSALDTTPRVFSFAVIGELPFATSAEPAVANLLQSIDSSTASFTIHLGDIKGLDESCSDGLFETRKTLFENAAKPVVVLPGYNDWVACATTGETGSDAEEHLGRLRELFDGENAALGQQSMTLTRQSVMRRFRGYAENVRWQFGRILFIGLNVPGVNNDYRFAAGRNGEFEDRVIANRVWLERAFRLAETRHLPGVVVAFQGDPEFQHPLRPPDRRLNHRDGFYELKSQLRDLTSHYHGEVLVLHGGLSGSHGDSPLADAQGKTLRNFIRVQSFGSPDLTHWVHIDVDPRRARIFAVRFESVTAPTGGPASDSPAPTSAPPATE